MNEKITLSDIIWTYIRIRGKSLKIVSEELKVPYKTLHSALNRDSIDAYLLFRLKNCLDMDLDWVANMVDKKRNTSRLDPLMIPRMEREFRNHVKSDVDAAFRRIEKETLGSIATIRNALLAEYDMYFLLDVLLPLEYHIMIMNDGSHTRYFCMPMNMQETVNGRRRMAPLLISGKEMLDSIIAERKE